MKEIFFYNKTDITEDVTPNIITYDMYSNAACCDTLYVVFDDDAERWEKWGTKIDDTIEYVSGNLSTGTMYVADKGMVNDKYYLYCTAIPSAAKLTHTKGWESVYLEQIFTEVCKRFGFEFVRKCDNPYYKYISQINEKDISFLARIAKQEGCCMIARDNTIYLYSEKDLESQEAKTQLDTEDGVFESNDGSNLFGISKVYSGIYKGMFVGEKTQTQFTTTVQSNSDAESARFAKNILRNRNKNLVASCRLKTELEKELTAGTVAKLNSDLKQWNNQEVFVSHVRHEYHSEETTIFMRKKLEGY